MVKNVNYREFLDKGIIKTLGERDILRAMKNITGRYKLEGRALLITLYYTGARPIEVLNLTAKDIKKEDSYLIIQIPASKGGKARPFYLQYDNELVKELYGYASKCFPDMYLFFHFKGNYRRLYKTKSGKITERFSVADKLRYYFKKWFKDIEGSIPPYFLRHNRFSKASLAGMSDREIKQLKGSGSIDYYTHLSAKTAKQLAKKIK